MKYLTPNRRRQIVFAAFVAFVFTFAAPSTATAQRKFQANDEIPMGGGWTYRIVECRVQPATRLEECDYISVHEGGSTRDARTASVFDLRRYVQSYEEGKKQLAKSDPGKSQKLPAVIMPPTEVPSENVELTVTAQQLHKDYTNNETAAMRKYVDKIVRVTGGLVYLVSSENLGVKPTKAYLGSAIQCQIEDTEQLATLNKDEPVTIIGMPRGGMLSTGVSFLPCRVEQKNAAQTVKPETVKTPVKTAGTANGKIVGTWYYTAIINDDGTEKKLNNSESYLWLKEDGNYENRFGSSYGQSGTFAASGSRLTLNRENGEKQVYTMSVAGTTMTLKSGAGGYKLEKE